MLAGYLRVYANSEGPVPAHSDQGLRCPQTKSLDIIECFSGEQRPGWYFVHAQDDLNPHILPMLEGTFSLDAAQQTFFIATMKVCLDSFETQIL